MQDARVRAADDLRQYFGGNVTPHVALAPPLLQHPRECLVRALGAHAPNPGAAPKVVSEAPISTRDSSALSSTLAAVQLNSAAMRCAAVPGSSNCASISFRKRDSISCTSAASSRFFEGK